MPRWWSSSLWLDWAFFACGTCASVYQAVRLSLIVLTVRCWRWQHGPWRRRGRGPIRRRSPRVAWSVAEASYWPCRSRLMFTYLPVQTAFLISRPAALHDRLADHGVAAGGKVDRPEWAGLFLVRKIAPARRGLGHRLAGRRERFHRPHRLIRAATSDAEPQIPPAPSCFYRFAADKRWYHHELDDRRPVR